MLIDSGRVDDRALFLARARDEHARLGEHGVPDAAGPEGGEHRDTAARRDARDVVAVEARDVDVLAALAHASREGDAGAERCRAAREHADHLVREVVHEAAQLACTTGVGTGERRRRAVRELVEAHLDADASALAHDAALDDALCADGLPGGGRDAEILGLEVRGEPARIEHVEERDEPEVVAEDLGALGAHRLLAEDRGHRDAIERALGRIDVDDDRVAGQLLADGHGDLGRRCLERAALLHGPRGFLRRGAPSERSEERDHEREGGEGGEDRGGAVGHR
jgi:hypothetical protein